MDKKYQYRIEKRHDNVWFLRQSIKNGEKLAENKCTGIRQIQTAVLCLLLNLQ